MTNRKRNVALIAVVVLSGGFGWRCSKAPANPGPPAIPAVVATPAPQPVSPSDWFHEATTAECGISFPLGHKAKGPFVVRDLMGGGAAICDFNNDGHADIFLVAPQDIAPGGACVKLYKNLGGGKFQDVTAGSGINVSGMLMGCATGDIDNDGLADLLITGYGVVKLYKNLGNFKFKDITAGSGLESTSPTSWYTSAAFADVDNDGKLDVYIGRYVIFDKTTQQYCKYGEGRLAACGPVFYDPQHGSLYRNLGGGKFKDVTEAFHFGDVHGKVLGVAWADINGDGKPDLYLANDEVNADLFVSGKDGKYKNVALTTGVALSADGKPQGGMGVDFGDYNRDGKFDLFVTTFQFEPDSLYAAGAGGLFQWTSSAAGLDAPTNLMVGFGTKFLDVNNDGWLDIAVANGHIHDNQEQIDSKTTYRQPMQLFVSDGGTKFLDRSRDAGPGFTRPGVGRGLAVGDLDDDGREDVIIMDMEGPTRILFNRTPNPGNWLRIKLVGAKSNRMGLGAVVTVTAGKEKWIGNCTTGGSYLSASDPRLHFGIGKATAVDSIEIRWPGGKRSTMKPSGINRDITIEEPR